MLKVTPLDIQGHRGARGLYPENTITAFIHAVKLGVNTLEMDVVISKDAQIIVSHEPWMNSAFCTKPNGDELEKNPEEKYNLYNMTYSEIASFDCGKRVNNEFPLQKNMPEHKPLLSEVIKKVDAFTRQNNLPYINYNIEIKSEPSLDGIFNPAPAVFVNLVYSEIKKQNIISRTTLQSFDVRALQEIRKRDANIKIGLLVENNEGLEKNLSRLDFLPNIYSPEYILVTNQLIKKLHSLHIQVIPWTVNEISDMKKLISMDVDGIITDYPDRAVGLMR